jgi:hypothetical protein
VEEWKEGEPNLRDSAQKTILAGRNSQTLRQRSSGLPTRVRRFEESYLGEAGSPELWATVGCSWTIEADVTKISPALEVRW